MSFVRLSVVAFVSVAVVVLLWIPLTQCFLIQSSYKKNITSSSNISHNVGTTNSSTQEFNKSNEITLNNLDGEMRKTQVLQSDSAKCPGCSCGRKNRKKRIVGGVPAEPNEFPWRAIILYTGKHLCAATVITKRHILTAAHCMNNTLNISITDLQALIGRDYWWESESYELKLGFEEIILHPEFQPANIILDIPDKHDIAILKLNSSISFNTSYILPSCLPNSENQNYTDLTAVAIGWGFLNESATLLTPELLKVEVPIMSLADCRKNYNDISTEITDGMICTDTSGQKDSCNGDSGGPIHISLTKEVIGITSWGRGCARPNCPGIYTRIAKYMPWIKENIEGECLCYD